MGERADSKGGAEDAIVQVLRAERESHEAVARCAAEAAARVAEAHARAEEIRARTERRIGLARARIAAAAQRRIAALSAPLSRPGAESADEERFRRAAEALVAELMGGVP